MTSVLKDPILLRNQIVFWAISANLTDLVDTGPSLVDNFFKAKIKPNALSSNDVLNLALNPRKAICQGDLPTKIIVSENITKTEFQVGTKIQSNKKKFS